MTKELKAAITARDAYLKGHPRLAAYQAEIDRVLDATPEHLRVEAISMLTAAKVAELRSKTAELVLMVAEATGVLK